MDMRVWGRSGCVLAPFKQRSTADKLSGGEVYNTNYLVTLNRDILQSAQDVIEHCEDLEFLRAV